MNIWIKMLAEKSDGSEATWGWGGGLSGPDGRFWASSGVISFFSICKEAENEFRHPAIFHGKQAPCEPYPGLNSLAGCAVIERDYDGGITAEDEFVIGTFWPEQQCPILEWRNVPGYLAGTQRQEILVRRIAISMPGTAEEEITVKEEWLCA